MSETAKSDNPSSSPDIPRPAAAPRTVVVARNAVGAVVRWEAPPAEALANAIPGLAIKSLCGVGGMGAVYRAEQCRLGRAVAVKILPAATAPDPEARERFVREAHVLSGLNHPHILQIYDFGSLTDETLYFVTEWADGGDLAKILVGGARPLPEVQAWVRQIAGALGAAHAQGVIHRDLKPANVLVLADGRLTLGDFGLAHTPHPAGLRPLTSNGALFGTFDYMAPEQMGTEEPVTPATDLYALGVMTYQMITGRVPRGAYTRASRLAKNVPPQVDAFLAKTMATDPAARPRDAAEFVRLFEQACATPRRRQRRQLIGLGVSLILFTLAWARWEIIRAEREASRAQAREAEVSEALRAYRAAQQGRLRQDLEPEPPVSAVTNE